MSHDEKSRFPVSSLPVVRGRSQETLVPVTAVSKSIFLGLTAGARAKYEKSLAVAEEARLRRVIASEEIAYRQTTLPERWTRRIQGEDDEAQLASLENLTAMERLQLERDQIVYARERVKLEAQLHQNQLNRTLVADEVEEEESVTAEQLAGNLTVLKSYIDGLKADKQLLINVEASGQDSTWQEVQEITQTITQYEVLYRELHGNYTKFILGIA
jgi:D-ribose pyranose/furanose isomerase RbsD